MTSSTSVLLDAWDAQQAAYVAEREARFEIMLDVIAQAHALDAEITVLDLACGPGSLSHRVLTRFPRARVLGVDYDPVLLALARDVLGARHGERFVGVDADLADAAWPEALGGERIDVVVSSTALHWLEIPQLVGLYGILGALLAPGGVFLNADHLRYDPVAQPSLTAWAEADDRREQAAAHARGVPTWDEWWDAAVAVPALGRRREERERRFADRPPTPDAPLALHLAALRASGFSEADVVWRRYDDVVVCARR